MADKKHDSKSEAKPEAEAAPKKKGGMKFAIITLALLLIEGGALFAFFSMGGPKDAQATHTEEAKPADPGDEPCEVPVFSGPLYNDRKGSTYGFKVEVFVTTKVKHRDAITAKVEQGKAGIRAEIAGIWRMASSEDLAEEMFESLRRRIEAKLMVRLNPPEDPTKASKPAAKSAANAKASGSDGDHGAAKADDHAAAASGSADHPAADASSLPRITGAVVISTPPVKQDR